MPAQEKQLLEFIARIVYNIDGLSSELRLYFNQYITFHFSGKLSVSQIQDIENRKAAKNFKGLEELTESSNSFSIQDKVWVVASMQLLQSEAERLDDRIISRKISKKAIELISVLGLDGEKNGIEEERNRIEAETYRFQNRPTIKIPVSILPLGIDYGIRWTLLLAFGYWGKDLKSLIPLNIQITFLFFIINYVVDRLHKKHNQKLLNAYGGADQFKIEYEINARQYTWLAIFLGSSIFIHQLITENNNIWPVLIAFLLYYSLFLRMFRIGKLSENDLVRQLEKENLDTSKLTVDGNDEVIVQLDTKLNSATGRLEAYVLESALFGALSFSGFLQIMATDLINFKDLENFASSIFVSAQALIHFDWVKLSEGIEVLSTKESLFCLISVESLVCSIFFLAVIASRLRFSDIGDRVRTAINMAKAFNEKEEVLHHGMGETQEASFRLTDLTKKVNGQLHIANRIMDEITPVMTYMVYFRNAGILVFVIILISSSLFIAGALSWIFIGLVAATLLYFNRQLLAQKFNTWLLNFRIEFVRQGFLLFGFSVLPIGLALTLRIFFQVANTDFLFSLGAFFIGIYLFAWLLLSAHVDESFGELEMNQVKQKRWKLVKTVIAVIILLTGLAMAFRKTMVGYQEFIMIAMMSLAVLMYFVGYYLTKIWWLGIICGWIIAIAFVGVLFKILHLAGANEMIFLAFLAFLALTPIIFWKRNLFHQLLLKFCFAGFLLSFWYVLPMFTDIPLSLRLAYEHATADISEPMNVIEINTRIDGLKENAPMELENGMRELDQYIDKHGTRLGFTGVYFKVLWSGYFNETWRVMDHYKESKSKDEAALLFALKAVQKGNQVLSMFDYKWLEVEFRDADTLTELINLEAKILVLLNRREEAVQSLQLWLKKDLPPDIKNQVLAELKEIESGAK